MEINNREDLKVQCNNLLQELIIKYDNPGDIIQLLFGALGIFHVEIFTSLAGEKDFEQIKQVHSYSIKSAEALIDSLNKTKRVMDIFSEEK